MHLVIHSQLQESSDHCIPFMLCHISSFLTQQIPQSLGWLLCSSSLVQTRHYQQQHRVQLTAGCLPCCAVPAVVVVLPARNALSVPPPTSSHAGHKSAITTVWPDRGSNMAATRSQQHPATTTTPSCWCSITRCSSNITMHDFVVIVIKLSNSDHGQ